MENKEKNLFYLDDLSDYKVASDYSDVRGWKVIDANNHTIGEVDGLLVNKKAERVVYLDIEVDKDLIEAGHEPYESSTKEGAHEYLNKEGENHLIIPIGMVDLDEDNNKVITHEVGFETFKKTKRYKKGSDIERDYEMEVYRNYNPDDSSELSNVEADEFYNRKQFEDRRRR